MIVNVNEKFKDKDFEVWQKYKKSPTIANRDALLNQMSGVINNQVNKWSGAVARDVLMNKAKLLAVKAFDKYDPNSGTTLATFLTNQLLPISRIVYTYQNAMRVPEQASQKLRTYMKAVENMQILYGRDPTMDELHSELGWPVSEINRIKNYQSKELIESGPKVNDAFFRNKNQNDEDDMVLGGIYFELTPEEKELFDHTTGYNGAPILNNAGLTKKFGITQTQLSYKKKLLNRKVGSILNKYGY